MRKTDQRSILEQRIELLAAMQNGWKDGNGLAPTPAAISAARKIESGMPKYIANDYAGFATLEGGITLEPRDETARHIEISPSGKISEE